MIKLFEMCSGYGGASFGLKLAKIDFEIVGYSEINKSAIKCYEQNHGNITNFGNCSKIIPEELPDFDLLTCGFPCQSFSIQGNRAGFEDIRGMIFFDIIRIAKIKKPKYMLLENVKGLTNHEEGRTLNRILSEIRKAGYGICYKVLNSRDYGIPQNRERIWFVCKLGGWNFMEFMFPEKERLEITVKDLLENEVDEKYNLTEKQLSFITDKKRQKKKISQNNKNFVADFRMDEGLRIREDNVSPCIKAELRPPQQDSPVNRIIVHSLQPRSVDRPSFKKAREAGKPYPGGYGHLKREDGISYCLNTQNDSAIEYSGKFRQLTPKECFRLMGFLNDDINLKKISDRQLYKLAGNGWDCNLVSKLFKQMFK